MGLMSSLSALRARFPSADERAPDLQPAAPIYDVVPEQPVFPPTGLLGAGPQSTAWLYMFWHGGFPLTVIAYALLKDDGSSAGKLLSSVRRALLCGIGAVLVAVAGLTLIATTGQVLLPAIMQGN